MLFDKNGFYMIDTPKKDYDFAIDIMTGNTDNLSSKSVDLYNLDEGFRRGNAFPKLYRPYKNYEPGQVKVRSEREKCLLEIQKLDFFITDLNLYLDIHPDDMGAYRLFKEYVEACRKKKDEYKKIYGPLLLDQLTDEYEWSSSVWPWERKGM